MEQSKNLKFQKPDFQKLNQKGYTVVDMHVHTNVSDGADAPQEIIKRAKVLGVGIAITDHNKIRGAVEAYHNNLEVFVIPGIELTSRERRHYLLYFRNIESLAIFFKKEVNGRVKRIPGNEIIALKNKYHYLISVAHPNGWNPWHNFKLDFDIKRMDCLEVLNSSCKPRQIKTSLEWATAYKKGFTGGSDAHLAQQIGRVVTYSQKTGIEKFLDSVRSREAYVTGELHPFWHRRWEYIKYWPWRRFKSSLFY